MAVLTAIDVLNRFALAHVGKAEHDEQIQVYQALSETLPSEVMREAARAQAVSISEIAARQLELHLNMQRVQEDLR